MKIIGEQDQRFNQLEVHVLEKWQGGGSRCQVGRTFKVGGGSSSKGKVVAAIKSFVALPM